MDTRFQHPFTALIAGATGSGKSYFTRALLQHATRLIHPTPDRVVWCYGEWQPLYDSMPWVEFHEGLPDREMFQPHVKTVVVVDDLMVEADERVTALFTKGSHHRNVSVLYLVQNLFHKGKDHRTISLNAQYLVLFKNPRDASQINHIAKQMYPGHTTFVRESFEDATREPHGYLLIDLKQTTPDHLRLRTKVVPGDIQIVYMRKV